MFALATSTIYIAAAWIVTFTSVAVYALWVIKRGRDLSRQVPEDRRRWM
jgi:O-antigen/teichoic acid export membrane protein